jgi:sirohydrochlorin cobaltochelatase
MRDAALLLLGHGSTLNADSSAPTYQHAEEIRRRGLFAEVHVAFWKEEPNFRQALRQIASRTVYAVPNFISSGYFTEQVIPRELGLAGSVTSVEGHDVHYCEPVGLSPVMTGALLQRAGEVVAQSGETPDLHDSCLFICGHGTSFNDNSTKIIHEQAQLIRERGLYADCQPCLMEQRPFVKDWRTLTDCRNVIVVPFFISDGLHSYEDIPVLLGLTHNIREKGFTNPHREGDRRLWYATAIGTDAAMVDVILGQVEKAVAAQSGGASSPGELKLSADLPIALPARIGQVRIEADFRLHHVDDQELAGLRVLHTPAELRELIFRDCEGAFRPLRAAPTLRRGWLVEATDAAGVRAALEYIYPAELENFQLWREGRLPITPWRETAERQTGRFRIVREIDDAGAVELTAQVCDRQCGKRRLWSPAAQEVAPAAGEIPLLCPEACNYLVGKAREKIKGPDAE